MLEIGTKVIICNNSNKATVWAYDQLVDMIGEITNTHRDRDDHYEHMLRVVIKDAVWNIHEDDCIPIDPNSNREAMYLLRR